MSTIATTNLKNASSASNNIVLNSDGTIGGAALAGVSDVFGTRTTGTITSSTTSLTVASATGITSGMYVVGEGITPGTTVSNVVSTTVTLSANANTTLSSDPVTFYSASKVVTPAAVGGMLCRAWVNFDGTATVAGNYIRASYNVSSITDNGTGDYTVNFTTSMPDTNYAVVTQGKATDSASIDMRYAGAYSYTTASVRTVFVNFSSVAGDPLFANVAIFR